MPIQVRILKLNRGDHLEKVLYRFEKGWTLRFVLGPSLMGHRIRLFTNHPASAEDQPDRLNFREITWNRGSKVAHDDLSQFADVVCHIAGPFSYFFLCDSDDLDSAAGSGFFQVAPVLKVGKGTELPLDCVQCQTYLAKLLGPLSEWKDRLRVSKESGYNVAHITPVQDLGISNSSYSLKDHLKINPAFKPQGDGSGYGELAGLVNEMCEEWEMLTISDVVWNHCALNSPFLKEHPECAYNLHNSPHLRPAYALDRILFHFAKDVAANKYADRGLPFVICDEKHLEALRRILYDELFPGAKLHEFFQLDVEDIVQKFADELDKVGAPSQSESVDCPLTIVQDPTYRRFGSTVNMPLALLIYNRPRPECSDEKWRKERCVAAFRQRIYELNEKAGAKCWLHVMAAVDALCGHVRYERVAPEGLQVREYSETYKLFPQYFSHFGPVTGPKTEELLAYGNKNMYIWAFNGWVMGDDPLKNFAEPPSMVYMRRELVCWGDSVKLRYGNKAEDCPYLWKHMADYTKLCAKTFHGLRLDNCHSTPIHVAEYLLEQARKVRPDLYVVAELFTGGEDLDNIFVNRLGITSLIREAQSAGDSHEEGRLVYKYGGVPVGAFIQRPVRPIAPSIAHALFLDLTHDNPCPLQKRTVFDCLPSAALVAMACCGTGSNRGYDELVPYQINVVSESRLYTTWSEDQRGDRYVNDSDGIIVGKRILNQMHYDLGEQGYDQVFVDQMTADIVAVTRHNPKSHQSVILVARTVFSPDRLGTGFAVPTVRVSGKVEEVLFEMRLRQQNGSRKGSPKSSSAAASYYINGLPNYQMEIKQNINMIMSEMAEVTVEENLHEWQPQEIELKHFPPGSVFAVRVSMPPVAKSAIVQLRGKLSQFGFRMRSLSGAGLKMENKNTLRSILDGMSLRDLNRALFRCHDEEADEGRGGGAYHIPGFGSFVFCGLQGILPLMGDIRLNNDLGHPVCENLRAGLWLPDYIAKRLQAHSSTKKLGYWYEEIFKNLNDVPHYLRPCYFDAVLTGSYNMVREALWSKMSDFVKDGSDFLRALALGSVAFCGYCRSGILPMLSEHIAEPHPPTVMNDSGKKEMACVTISAGLPHFSHGLFRNWGRDTFIALPGCLLVPGRHQEARWIILSFAGTLRHGLIPNLLGEGTHARFNCRDAVWFWLHAIKLYVESVKPGEPSILDDQVRRMYPDDDTIAGQHFREEPLKATMQEALQRHFEGISYRERNAGRAIDEHMSDEGFNIDVCVNVQTGFVCGGNGHNCGTWMDKMGSSDKAGNRGKPATPRDGAAVELQGLCYAVVSWLEKMHANGSYPYAGVKRKGGEHGDLSWTWAEWAQRLRDNFERYFYVSSTARNIQSDENPKPELVNRSGIIKDSVGSAAAYTDYELRPNFAITLALAPELVSPEHAWEALCIADKAIKGPMGMKTLDPGDWAYDGNYNNADDSHEFKRAKGLNYHQGPEWVWLMGYFLRAQLAVASRLRATRPEVWQEAVSSVKQTLGTHWTHLQGDVWRSLPELTNTNGSYCPDSCRAQAWSVGCILEVLADFDRYGQDK